MFSMRICAVCLAAGVAMSAEARGSEREVPLKYTVRFPAAQTHYLEVEAEIPTGGAEELTLYLPVWTPGSYLVREYARNLEDLSAEGAGVGVRGVEKVRKNRWKVSTGGATLIRVTYRVYCREMGVQTSWVDSGFALINGAGTFVTLADGKKRAHEVMLVLPEEWKGSYTGLPNAPGEKANHYVAADYDELVDSPIYAGSPAVYEFKVDGKTHLIVNEGEGGVWDGKKAAKDVETIVKTQRDFWGSLPYEKYVFLNMLTETGGGLEHRNSTVLMGSRWGTRTRKGYLGWLQLVSHEFFHTWNVKRLRPVELGPFDYEAEVATKSLWIAEGFTSYYGDLLLRRAGLCTTDEYLAGRPRRAGADADDPTNDIGRLQSTPGRLVQALEASSFDTWIKFYRPDENTPNTAISYYTKGSVVGFLLDAKIRRATDGKKSLDDVMKLAYERYSGIKGYTPEEFRGVASEVAGRDLSVFFVKALETTEELDYDQALGTLGLRFKKEDPSKEKDKAKEPVKAWLGLATKGDGGRLLVSQVRRETPGFEAGFNVGDEILAVGDERMRSEVWKERMEQYEPGDKVSVLISRRDRLMRLEATFGKEPPKPWGVELDPKASEEAKRLRKGWLGE